MYVTYEKQRHENIDKILWPTEKQTH